MRIGFFVQSVWTAGTYFRFHNLARALTDLGHSVVVHGASAGPRLAHRREMRDGVPYEIVIDRPGRGPLSPSINPITAAARLRSQQQFDVAHLFQPFPAPVPSWYLSSRVRIYDWDDLWGSGGLLTHSVPTTWRTWLERRALVGMEQRLPRLATHVTTVSEDLANLALTRGATGVSIIGNGFWPRPPIDKISARLSLGLPTDGMLAGFMGRTFHDLEWCIAGVAATAKEHPEVRLAVCGPPKEVMDGIMASYSEDVRARVIDLGSIAPDHIPAFSAALDLGLLPLEATPWNTSRFPIKLPEYFMMGTPVLASEVGATGEIIRRHGGLRSEPTREGWVCAFTDAVDRWSRHRLVRADADVAAESMNWLTVAQVLEKTYTASLAAHAGESVLRES